MYNLRLMVVKIYWWAFRAESEASSLLKLSTPRPWLGGLGSARVGGKGSVVAKVECVWMGWLGQLSNFRGQVHELSQGCPRQNPYRIDKTGQHQRLFKDVRLGNCCASEKQEEVVKESDLFNLKR